MSWFTAIFTRVLPFAVDAFETRDLRQSGDKLFGGLAAKLKEVAGDPDKVREIAGMLEEKSGELTGAIVARTPAAGLVDEEFMPPGSVDPTQEQVTLTGPTGTTGPAPASATTAQPPKDEEYEYDDSEDDNDEPDTGQHEPDKPKAPKKKKKR
jgi:hypothetical protein